MAKIKKIEKLEDNETNILSFGRSLDYYTSGGRKVGDFFLGFFGIWILQFILGILFIPLVFIPYLGSLISAGLQFVIAVTLIVFAFVYRRWWLGIGAIVSIIVSFILLALLLFFLFAGGLW